MEITLRKNDHVYLVDGKEYPSVTTILRDTGFISTAFYTDEGRQIGEAVHAACEYLDRGISFAVSHLDPRVSGRVRAYEKFRKDTGFKPILIEEMVFNKDHLYCGTLDRTGIMNGREVLIDLKSGTAPTWAGCQLWAYAMCLGGSLFIKDQYVLQLKATGKYVLTKFGELEDRMAWLSAVSVFYWKRNHNIGGPS